jgi:hypothetical protein
MPDQTAATLSPSTRSDGALDLMHAVKRLEGTLVHAHGGKPVPAWMDTDEVGEDGYLVAMPPEDKLREHLIHAEERERWAEEAEQAGEQGRAAFERQQAQQERRHATRLQETLEPKARTIAVVRSKSVATPRRAESSGRPAVRGSSRRSSAKSGDSGEDELAEPPAGPAERRPSDRSRTTCNRDGCDNSIEHLASQARFCDDRGCKNKRDAASKAASRKRERESRERELEREAERDFEDGAFEQPRVCKCKPPHEFERGHCNKCGHDLKHDAGGRVHGSVPLKSRLIVVHTRGRPHRPERYGDRKRKPVVHKPLEHKKQSGEVNPM